MIIDRRSFIQGVTFATSSVVLARSLQLPPVLASIDARAAGRGSGGKPVVFRIAGWDMSTNDADENEVVILINQSWRTAWR
jgi:hypothetical protein